MLQKQQRLTKAAFATYFKTGTRTHTPLLQLVYTPAKKFHGAVVVGKKVSTKAVTRNLLRRRVYSQLYRWQADTHHTGVYIILLKPPAGQATAAQLRAAVAEVLQKQMKPKPKT